MQFTFRKWSAPTSTYERVYLNHQWLKDLKMWFDCWDDKIRCDWNMSFKDYPKPYCNDINPALAVKEAALREHGLDPDNFTWEELLDACQ